MSGSPQSVGILESNAILGDELKDIARNPQKLDSDAAVRGLLELYNQAGNTAAQTTLERCMRTMKDHDEGLRSKVASLKVLNCLMEQNGDALAVALAEASVLKFFTSIAKRNRDKEKKKHRSSHGFPASASEADMDTFTQAVCELLDKWGRHYEARAHASPPMVDAIPAARQKLLADRVRLPAPDQYRLLTLPGAGGPARGPPSAQFGSVPQPPPPPSGGFGAGGAGASGFGSADAGFAFGGGFGAQEAFGAQPGSSSAWGATGSFGAQSLQAPGSQGAGAPGGGLEEATLSRYAEEMRGSVTQHGPASTEAAEASSRFEGELKEWERAAQDAAEKGDFGEAQRLADVTGRFAEMRDSIESQATSGATSRSASVSQIAPSPATSVSPPSSARRGRKEKKEKKERRDREGGASGASWPAEAGSFGPGGQTTGSAPWGFGDAPPSGATSLGFGDGGASGSFPPSGYKPGSFAEPGRDPGLSFGSALPQPELPSARQSGGFGEGASAGGGSDVFGIPSSPFPQPVTVIHQPPSPPPTQTQAWSASGGGSGGGGGGGGCGCGGGGGGSSTAPYEAAWRADLDADGASKRDGVGSVDLRHQLDQMRGRLDPLQLELADLRATCSALHEANAQQQNELDQGRREHREALQQLAQAQEQLRERDEVISETRHRVFDLQRRNAQLEDEVKGQSEAQAALQAKFQSSRQAALAAEMELSQLRRIVSQGRPDAAPAKSSVSYRTPYSHPLEVPESAASWMVNEGDELASSKMASPRGARGDGPLQQLARSYRGGPRDDEGGGGFPSAPTGGGPKPGPTLQRTAREAWDMTTRIPRAPEVLLSRPPARREIVERTHAHFRGLLGGPEGCLYEDGGVALELGQVSSSAGGGRSSISFEACLSNISNVSLHDIRLRVARQPNQSHATALRLDPDLSSGVKTLAARQGQLRFRGQLDVHAPFEAAPQIELEYLLPDNCLVCLQLRLPLFVTRLMKPDRPLEALSAVQLWDSPELARAEVAFVCHVHRPLLGTGAFDVWRALEMGGALRSLPGLDENPRGAVFESTYPQRPGVPDQVLVRAELGSPGGGKLGGVPYGNGESQPHSEATACRVAVRSASHMVSRAVAQALLEVLAESVPA